MKLFDFITGDDFRSSLEEDYRELNACMEARAWKAVHVIAGSIIEAILADYLIAIGYAGGDPLRMEFALIIKACVDQNILPSEAADLSTVVRQYRNLIHPGRVIRLEKKVDEQRAKIALALVDVIIEEVENHKGKTYGLTAEQIVAKIKDDNSGNSILEDLLQTSKPIEIERLLLKVIPETYFEINSSNPPPQFEDFELSGFFNQQTRTLAALEMCFHVTFGVATEELKKKVMKHFVAVVKKDSGTKVLIYETVFFRGPYFMYLSNSDQNLVKKHLFESLSSNFSDNLLNAIKGLRGFLEPNDIEIIIPYFANVITNSDHQKFKNAATSYLESEFIWKNPDENGIDILRDILIKNLSSWVMKKKVRSGGVYNYIQINPFQPIIDNFMKADGVEDETDLDDIPFLDVTLIYSFIYRYFGLPTAYSCQKIREELIRK